MSTSTFKVSLPLNTSASAATDSSGASPSRRKKRSQVARACDGCRLHRIKCDNAYPCSNCSKRGAECSDDRQVKSTTLPQAYREIDRLKQRVQELELELDKERQRDNPAPQLRTPSSANNDETLKITREPNPGISVAKKGGEGIHISTARSPNKSWYGPASLFYFIGRINAFLTHALKQTHSAERMMPDSAGRVLDEPATVSVESHPHRSTTGTTSHSIRTDESLTPTQEEYFLDLFWRSTHPSYPILDELEFKAHYQTLWATSSKDRKPSALVDIVLAVCMQYGMARIPAGHHNPTANTTDSTVAGRWHYRRCLTLLSPEMESPTISTLQCHLLCALYLCYGSFQNMADNACGLAVRTAYMLGLHLEPPHALPRRKRELRKRLWWAVYVLESKRSMKLGRPFTIHDSTGSCALPADDREIARLSGSSFAPIGEDVTWLTWNLHNTKLMIAAREAYTSFYDRGPDPGVRCDIQPIMNRMEEWRMGVPDALKTSRHGNGEPFSTDLTLPDIEAFTPRWLQRQRLLLELWYHNLCVDLYRPSIGCVLAGAPGSLMENAASKCAAHAMALTHIMHQVLATTSLLDGGHEAYQWQWNAAITLVGYILAYPRGSTTGAARDAIDRSVVVLGRFATSFAVAGSAKTIMGELVAKVDWLTGESARDAIQSGGGGTESTGMEQIVGAHEDPGYQMGLPGDELMVPDIADWGLDLGDEAMADIGGVLGQTIDISAENFVDLDWAAVHNNYLDPWAFM